MSKKQFIKRHHLIINKLRKKPSSFDEIQDYLKIQSELEEENYEMEIRTFQRDLKEIASLYSIEIEYNRSSKVYEIIQDVNEINNERLVESFELFNALSLTENLSKYIILEKRRPMGTENMFGLLHAIKNRFVIEFLHEKFWDEDQDKKTRIVHPLALKESRYRWYLVALDEKDSRIKSFALDRISNIVISQKKFQYPDNYNPEIAFQNSFGIINDGTPAQKILLSFTFEQGKYIKSLPMHYSQKIIIDNEKELRIELFLQPTYDFAMELLSIGKEVKVIEPKELQNKIIRRFEEALERYK
jgi:predicted DNA-binding transcriptional regulator YafY